MVSTIGSVYDTTLSVWSGTPGNLTAVACNDDISSGQYTQSQLSFSATAGTTYYFMVAPFGPPDTGADLAGGKTVLNVSNANPGVVLSASPLSQTVAAGASATYTITNSSNAAIALTCTGLPPTGAACTPVTVPANSSASLVITTTSRTSLLVPGSRPKAPFHPGLRIDMLTLLVISIIIFTANSKRRVLALVPLGTLAVLLIFVAAGCGSSVGTTVNPNGTPAGTYPITVTGTSASTTVTLVVT